MIAAVTLLNQFTNIVSIFGHINAITAVVSFLSAKSWTIPGMTVQKI
jgi:hypothetical protein